MENKNILPWIINGVLVLGLILTLVFPFKRESIVYKDRIVTDTLVEYVHDTIIHTSYKKIFVYDSVYIPDTIIVKDTTYVLGDYFSRKVLTDTLSNDSLLYAKSIYTISENRILDRTFEYKINRPTQINIISNIPEPKGSLWIGLSVGGNSDMFSLRPEIAYLTKSNTMYGYGYDIVNNTHNLSVMKKINFSKIWQRSKK